MQKVTDIKKVKADLAGDLAIGLSKVLSITEILAEHYHNHSKTLYPDDHGGDLYACKNSTCTNVNQLLIDSRLLISQGV